MNMKKEEFVRDFFAVSDDNHEIVIEEYAILTNISDMSSTSDQYRRTGTRYQTKDGKHVNEDSGSYQVIALGNKTYHEKNKV